jgi:restriction system protein
MSLNIINVETIKVFLEIMLKLWPAWVIIGIITGIKIIIEVILPKEIKKIRIKKRFKEGEDIRRDQEKIKWLRNLTPTQFEEYVAELFRNLGYKAWSVGGKNDRGIDVIVEKEGLKHYIQCKKYFKSHQVGPREIREFYGALLDRLAKGKGYFITTSKFTLAAEKFAEDKPIELIDGNKLLEYTHLTKIENNQEQKRCPKCGGKLIKREGKYGKFWGCSNYPKCKYTKNISQKEDNYEN